jgi:uncharacterized membrane protein
MDPNELLESASPIKRIISSIIDVICAIMLSTLAYSGLKNQNVSPSLLWFLVFIVSTCILVFISGVGTLGDIILRLTILFHHYAWCNITNI